MSHHFPVYRSHESEHVLQINKHVSTRVRAIARETLKMSELDLDDFLGEQPADKVVKIIITGNL